ncbi:MAG: TonB-dependent receptor, partial [Bacteroidales bacterium]|nr:TonB-dependent receptor [Bacteroidales bacterium]
MKYLKRISFAALFLSLCLPSFGQTNDPLLYTLDSIAVTGSRIPLSLGQSARIVTVMDSVKIAAMPAMSVNDLLKFAVAVDVRQRGVMGMQTDISIRSGTCDQIAILLNGINISDPQTGHNAGDFPVDISEIERIEILEGPAARAYG